MEAHFVHADKDDNLAVVAVMFDFGESNSSVAKVWAQMPIHPGDIHALKARLSADALLPGEREYDRFNGSLTTPPCSEGVRWLVMKDLINYRRDSCKALPRWCMGQITGPYRHSMPEW